MAILQPNGLNRICIIIEWDLFYLKMKFQFTREGRGGGKQSVFYPKNIMDSCGKK